MTPCGLHRSGGKCGLGQRRPGRTAEGPGDRYAAAMSESTNTAAPATTPELKTTPLHDFHVARGAKMVPYAGWSMPLHYGSILDEHHQVRNSGGLFDVSHMGRFVLRGPDARAFLDHVCTRLINGMADGQARYSIVCNERGGCHDDVLVYKVADADYRMVCNAANRAKLVEHFAAVKNAMSADFTFDDMTERSAMVALQGPKVMGLMETLSDAVKGLKRYRFVMKEVFGAELMIARTGYTGEDGVEIIGDTSSDAARGALQTLMAQLASDESDNAVIRPAGLGSRDSLRLEAAMALYGHEITEDQDPVSAQLGFAMKLDKGYGQGNAGPEAGHFIGQDALRAIADAGPKRVLTGLKLDSRRAARQDMNVIKSADDTTAIGIVSSGCLSPTLGESIAMAYVDAEVAANEGGEVAIDFGRQQIAAKIVKLPFYSA